MAGGLRRPHRRRGGPLTRPPPGPTDHVIIGLVIAVLLIAFLLQATLR